ncbi:general transcription factor IIF subunit 1 [Lutzomyia longipalpis]|uniref:general transcription factor IIF subunit 1 n=1 Tax=Lutzomyia longipalpis TaxID=7200 RepID=UPI002483AD73|nr:general transcription factor IIF subunit 1 [Lutzomyia longipalpis]
MNTGSSSSSAGQSSGAAGNAPNIQEFVIRVPKNLKKKHHVMRFNATLNVDFAQWKMVKMERENNAKDYRGMEEDVPKFGAGSEYNRDLKEEVRRKKFGIISRKYKPEAQPWILKVDKSGKKFKGIREGGVGENAAFYVFTHAPDKAIEAYPLHEWYNFQPIQRYKALSAEEAEQEFGRRKKVMNFFSLMLRKRLKGDDDAEEDPEEKKANRKKGKDLKISDMDEWIESSDESDSDDDDDEKKEKEEDSDKEKNAKKKGKKEEMEKKKKKKKDVDDEAFEESDDGDEEGRELDYISDSSDSDSDHEGKIDKDMKGVAEEDALRKLLTSDEESENEEKKSGEESDKEEDEKKPKEKSGKDGKDSKKKKLKKRSKDDKKESSSETSSDSSDSDDEGTRKSGKKQKDKDGASGTSKGASRSSQGESQKRKASSLPSDLSTPENSCSSPVNTPGKKIKLDTPSLPASFAGVVNASNKEDCGITEEDVRRYLMRKPMTTIELLTKFKNKKTGVSSDRLVETMTQILKKINPVKQTIQGKMYLSIKVNK